VRRSAPLTAVDYWVLTVKYSQNKVKTIYWYQFAQIEAYFGAEFGTLNVAYVEFDVDDKNFDLNEFRGIRGPRLTIQRNQSWNSSRNVWSRRLGNDSKNNQCPGELDAVEVEGGLGMKNAAK